MTERSHLEHLPGRVYLSIVALAATAAAVIAGSQLMSSRDGVDAIDDELSDTGGCTPVPAGERT